MAPGGHIGFGTFSMVGLMGIFREWLMGYQRYKISWETFCANFFHLELYFDWAIWSVWEPGLTLAAAIAFMLVMSVVSQRLTRNIWCYNEVTLTYKNTQMAALFRTIPYLPSFFFNTYYHKHIHKILIAAFYETFRQSSDPLYAQTPMRNVGELRIFNPKLRTSPESIIASCLLV